MIQRCEICVGEVREKCDARFTLFSEIVFDTAAAKKQAEEEGKLAAFVILDSVIDEAAGMIDDAMEREGCTITGPQAAARVYGKFGLNN